MKKCKNCGNVFADKYAYCNMCGSDAPKFSSFGSVLLSLLKGAGYFAFFLLMQVTVTVIFSAVISVKGILSGENIDGIYTSVLSQVSLITIVSEVLIIVMLILFFTVRGKNFFKELKIGKFVLWCIPLILLLGISLNMFSSFSMGLIPISEEYMEQYNELYSFMGKENVIVEFIAVAVIGPVAEEIIFRGLVFGSLRKTTPFWFSMLISSLVFGLAHGNMVSLLYTTLLGMLLAYLYERSSSLIVPILLHIGFNAGAYVVEKLPVGDDIVSDAVVIAASAVVSVGLAAAILYAHREKEDVVPVSEGVQTEFSETVTDGDPTDNTEDGNQ